MLAKLPKKPKINRFSHYVLLTLLVVALLILINTLTSKFMTNNWNSITSAYTYEYGGKPYEANSSIVINKPHYLKPQWFHTMIDGSVVIENESENGFNEKNYSIIKANTLFGAMPMIKGDYWGPNNKAIITWIESIDTPTKIQNQIDSITQLIIKHDFLGIEIDYEPTSIEATRSDGKTKITNKDIENKYFFLTQLSKAVHALPPKLVNNNSISRKVSVAIGATNDTTKNNGYQMVDYQKLVSTNADYIMIMNYDWWYSTDIYDGTSLGNRSSSPTREFEDTIKYATKTIPLEKIVMGIPDYGYNGQQGKDILESGIIRLNEAKKLPNFKNGLIVNDNIKFQNNSHVFRGGSELWFDTGTSIVNVPTTITMNAKRELCEKYGIKQVSVWSFNGSTNNPTVWFSGKAESINSL